MTGRTQRLPIRIIMAAWSTVMLTLMVCGLAAAMYFAMRHTIISAADENLSGRLREIGPFITSRLHSRHARDLAHEFSVHLEGLRPGGDMLQVRFQGRWLYRSASIAPYQLALAAAAGGAEQPQPHYATVAVQSALLRTLSATVRVGGASYQVEVATPIGGYFAMLERFRGLALFFLPALLALTAAGGYWLSRRALAPVEAVSASAREISASNLSRRLLVPRTGDEIQRLSETLNGMIGRLDEAFQRIGDFTANAAHELRSPIAVMLTTSELALREDESEAGQRAALEAIRAEAVRTAGLVEDLMALARADAGQGEPFRPLDLSGMVGEACRRGEALARTRHIHFAARVPAGIAATGNPAALLRMFMIFIDNALQYTPANGAIAIALEDAGPSAVWSITDTGIGIGADDLPHVFERFYRADPARSRDSGGSGLGLAIARRIAEAHHADIRLESMLGRGTTVRVAFPRRLPAATVIQ